MVRKIPGYSLMSPNFVGTTRVFDYNFQIKKLFAVWNAEKRYIYKVKCDCVSKTKCIQINVYKSVTHT